VTPPAELIAYGGAADVLSNLLLEIDPGHPALWRMVPGTGIHVQQPVDPLTRGLPPNPVSRFFARLADRVPVIEPVGRALDDAAERELSRYCFALGLFEEVRRIGTVPPGSLLNAMGPTTAVDEFLGAIPDIWVEDLAQLAQLFPDAFGDRFGRPAVLNPVFAQSRAVGGAGRRPRGVPAAPDMGARPRPACQDGASSPCSPTSRVHPRMEREDGSLRPTRWNDRASRMSSRLDGEARSRGRQHHRRRAVSANRPSSLRADTARPSSRP